MKILICGGEEGIMTAVEFRLKKQGFQPILLKKGNSVTEALENGNPDLLVINLDIEGTSGIEILRYTRQVMRSSLPIILVAEMEDEENLLKAMKEGADDFILQPFKPAELVLRIRKIFQDAEVES